MALLKALSRAGEAEAHYRNCPVTCPAAGRKRWTRQQCWEQCWAWSSHRTPALSWRRHPQPLRVHGKLTWMFLTCLVRANKRGPEKALGLNGCPRVGQFRLLMPSKAHGTFFSWLQCVCRDKPLLRWTAILETACARQERWRWSYPQVMHRELAAAKAGGDERPQIWG